MQKQLLFLFAGLLLTISLSSAQSTDDVSAIKTIVKNETDAFYQRKADF